MRRTAEDARETRRQIVAAGLAMFAQHGWEGTSFVRVAARAGVTRGAVHHYFADKTALLTAALDEGWSDAVAPALTLLADGSRPGAERLVDFLSAYVTGLADDDAFRRLAVVSTVVAPQAVALDAGVAAKRRGMSPWEERIAAALEDAALRPGVTTELATRSVITFIHGLTLDAATQPDRLPRTAEDARVLAAAAVHGLAL